VGWLTYLKSFTYGSSTLRKARESDTFSVVKQGEEHMASEKVEIALQIYDALNNALTVAGMNKETADKYSTFAVQLYQYIKDRPQLQEALQGAKQVYDLNKGAKGWAAAARLESNAKAMNSLGAAEKFATQGSISAGGAISTFVDYFAGVAQSLGIEMNGCAIAVTKVILDVLTTIALADTVVGVWAAALQALTVGADTKEMINACLVGQ
jgi:hypothetical protein